MRVLARGHQSAVVLNSDSPTLPTALLVETAEMLARPGERAVLGPSTDGGYYLLGLKTAHRRLFEDIAWSTESVAGQTLERAREIKLDVHVLPPGTTSTTATACAGSTAKCSGIPPKATSMPASQTIRLPRRYLIGRLWDEREFVRRHERPMRAEAANA